MRSLHIFTSILQEKRQPEPMGWPQAVLELKNMKDQAEAAQIKADSQVWPVDVGLHREASTVRTLTKTPKIIKHTEKWAILRSDMLMRLIASQIAFVFSSKTILRSRVTHLKSNVNPLCSLSKDIERLGFKAKPLLLGSLSSSKYLYKEIW